MQQQLARDGPDVLLVFPGNQILDRRLAVDAREQQGWKKGCGAGFERLDSLPGQFCLVSFEKRLEAQQKSVRRAGYPQALEQQMVEAESEIERRIAVPRAFGIEEHRTARAGQDVLGTDVA